MAAKDHIVTAHHDRFGSLPTGDGADVDPHGVVGKPVGFHSFAAVKRLTLHMVAHGHHAVGLGHAVETGGSHATFVRVGDIFCHIAQRDLLPPTLESGEAALAGEELLHEGLLAVLLGFDEGVELGQGLVPRRQDVGDLALFGEGDGCTSASLPNLRKR